MESARGKKGLIDGALGLVITGQVEAAIGILMQSSRTAIRAAMLVSTPEMGRIAIAYFFGM